VGWRNRNVTIGLSPFLELRHFFFALAAMSAAIVWSQFKWIGFSKTLGVFEPIASISFGIYISHYFLISNAHYLDKFISNRIILLTVYTLVCLLFSYLIERVIYIQINKYVLSKRTLNNQIIQADLVNAKTI
jgi:hypothetical protein